MSPTRHIKRKEASGGIILNTDKNKILNHLQMHEVLNAEELYALSMGSFNDKKLIGRVKIESLIIRNTSDDKS